MLSFPNYWCSINGRTLNNLYKFFSCESEKSAIFTPNHKKRRWGRGWGSEFIPPLNGRNTTMGNSPLFSSFPWPLWEKGLFSLFADIRGNASHFRVIAIWRERRALCKMIMLRWRLRRLWKARELPPNFAPLILRPSCGVLLPIMEIAKTYCNFKYKYFSAWEKRLLYSYQFYCFLHILGEFHSRRIMQTAANNFSLSRKVWEVVAGCFTHRDKRKKPSSKKGQ